MRRSARLLLPLACLLALLPPPAWAADPRPDTRTGLFDSYESLVAHLEHAWGSVFFDPKAKSLLVDGQYMSLRYNAPWQQLEFDVAWEKRAFSNKDIKCMLTVGKGERSKVEAFDVGGAFDRPGKYSLKLTYKNPTLSAYVNGKLAHKPITVTDPSVMETLQFSMNTGFASFRVSNPQLVASPEPAGAPPELPKPPASPKQLALFQTPQDFDKRWTGKKTATYDPAKKSISIPWEKGEFSVAAPFHYDARWQELEFTVVFAPSPLAGNLPANLSIQLETKGASDVSFRLDQTLARPGANQVKLIVDKGQTLTAFLNGKPNGHPMTIYSPETVNTLRFRISSSNSMEIANVKLKADPEP